MKVLFYLVLQSIDAEMAAKLKENLASVELSDPLTFKRIFDMLFTYAIDKTGDLGEVFGTNTVENPPLVDAALQPLKELCKAYRKRKSPTYGRMWDFKQKSSS